MGTQATFDLGEARQNALDFPLTLAEKYQPRIRDFVGLEEPKRNLLGLLARPRAMNFLAIGDPGSGKTVMGMKLAEQMPAIHHHVRAQSCDVETLERMWLHCNYIPTAPAKWHLLHVDEADGMTEKAQLQLLSWMDGTACLRPEFGGGFKRGAPLPIICYFTANSRNVNGEMLPPDELLPRFRSRCKLLKFTKVEQRKLAKYLAAIWELEKGPKGYPIEFFERVADGLGVRDALIRLDSELLAPRSAKDVRKMLDYELDNPDAVVVHEDEERWEGFMVEDGQSKLEALLSARVARSGIIGEIVEEANGKCRTIVTSDAGQYLAAIRQAQKPENTSLCGGCSWGLLSVPKKDAERALRKAEIVRGVQIAGRLVPWKAVGLANLAVTVEASGKVRVAKLRRCEYCKDQYPLPRDWRLEEQTAGDWSVAA